MRKPLIYILFLLAFALQASAQDNVSLVLWHADGTTTDVELYLKPHIEFTGDKVCISSDSLKMEYSKTDILRFTYKGISTDITSPQLKADYNKEGDRIVFHGINSTDKVAVYRSNGIRVPVRLTSSSDGFSLSLSSIPPGVYILNVNGKTSKFVRP